MRQAIEQQSAENVLFKSRNQRLEAEVRDLKNGLEAVEERARLELGMIRKDEIYFQIVELSGQCLLKLIKLQGGLIISRLICRMVWPWQVVVLIYCLLVPTFPVQ